jgi:hypothetical protein
MPHGSARGRRHTLPAGGRSLRIEDNRELGALALLLEPLGSRFPRSCDGCSRSYSSLQDYLRETLPIGAPFRMDVAADLLGALTRASCSCGRTLEIERDGIDEALYAQCVAQVEERCRQLHTGSGALVEALRYRMRSVVLRALY